MMLGIEHGNLHHIDTTDPVSDEFCNYFRQVTKTNVLIYEEVFGTLPRNRVRNFDQVNEYVTTTELQYTDPLRAQEKVKEIQGFVVEYPLYFLHEEVYLSSVTTRAGLLPSMMWRY